MCNSKNVVHNAENDSYNQMLYTQRAIIITTSSQSNLT